MHKKGEMLRDFVKATRHINFLDTYQIVEAFNDSIGNFNRFNELQTGGDERTAGRKLRIAGGELYHACEWALKHSLYQAYQSLFDAGSISILELQARQQKLQARQQKLPTQHMTLKNLIDEFKQVVSPHSSEIDFKVILDNSNSVNNGGKHNAKIPVPKHYRESAREIRKIIMTYVTTDVALSSVDTSDYLLDNAWHELKQDFDDFSETNTYILIVGPMTGLARDFLRSIFAIQWDLILDFDPSSDTNGLSTLYKEITGVNPIVRDLSPRSVANSVYVSSIPYWVMANGYVDDPTSIHQAKDWRYHYGRHLANFLEKFHSVYTKQAKVIICPFGDNYHFQKIVDDFNDTYSNGEDIEFVSLFTDQDPPDVIDANFKQSTMSLNMLLSHLSTKPLETVVSELNSGVVVPSVDGSKSMDNDFYAWLKNSFELVYIGIEHSGNDETSLADPRVFYDGSSPISWIGLRRHFNIDRPVTKSIEAKIREDLKDRARVIHSFEYEPGMGGTTELRKLAWEIHESNPVLILKVYLGEQTVNQVVKLYNLTKLPILILIDSNDVGAMEARRLHSELKGESFPFAIYYADRAYTGNKRSSDISPNALLKELTEPEIAEMKTLLFPYVENEECRLQLEQISTSTNEISPFIMAMYAFEEKFKGIKPYIQHFLNSINYESKKILAYISLADFVNRGIESQFFADLFENEEIEEFILRGSFRTLVTFVDKGTKNKQYFRIKYRRFATEILIQLSNGESGTSISFSNMLSYILSFIVDSRKDKYAHNRDTVELLRTLFITRLEDADSTKPGFSPLILEIQNEFKLTGFGNSGSRDIIGTIFKKLAEVYPDEPHFQAHLARFYFYLEQDYDKGITKINEAIDISRTSDPLLYHMKAMGYAARLTNKLIPEIKKQHRLDPDSDVRALTEQLQTDAMNAQELFKKVRDEGNGIAGYISDINLCVSIVDMGKFITDSTDTADFFTKNRDSLYTKYVDLACSLIEECRSMATEKDHSLLVETDGNLQMILGHLESTINLWERYLEQTTPEDKPRVRRMLARAYQGAHSGVGSRQMSQDEIKRIVKLMEQNIDELDEVGSNVRIWFNAVRLLNSDRHDEILDNALINLNRWVLFSGPIEAYYYRFILKFIKAVDGSTAAESELPKLLKELKEQAAGRHNKTTIHEWLGGDGEGLGKLLSAREQRPSDINNSISKKLQILRGRISSNYVNDNHAYISVFGLEVYFNPSTTAGEVDRSRIGQRVQFGLGFSYDGPRASYNSIKLDIDLENADAPKVLGSLKNGTIVKCEVIKNVDYYVKVRIVGFEVEGSIHVNCLSDEYNSENRPTRGRIFDAKVLRKGYDSRTTEELWQLTMKLDGGIQENISLTKFQRQLQELSLKSNTGESRQQSKQD